MKTSPLSAQGGFQKMRTSSVVRRVSVAGLVIGLLLVVVPKISPAAADADFSPMALIFVGGGKEPGTKSDLVLTLDQDDGEQQVKSVSVHLPAAWSVDLSVPAPEERIGEVRTLWAQGPARTQLTDVQDLRNHGSDAHSSDVEAHWVVDGGLNTDVFVQRSPDGHLEFQVTIPDLVLLGARLRGANLLYQNVRLFPELSQGVFIETPSEAGTYTFTIELTSESGQRVSTDIPVEIGESVD